MVFVWLVVCETVLLLAGGFACRALAARVDGLRSALTVLVDLQRREATMVDQLRAELRAELEPLLHPVSVELEELAAPLLAAPLGPLADLVKASVVVTLKTGTAFKGVVWEWSKEAVVLRNVEKAEAGKMLLVDGEVIVLVADVEFVQRP